MLIQTGLGLQELAKNTKHDWKKFTAKRSNPICEANARDEIWKGSSDLIFYTYDEIQNFRGTAFIELQFCRTPADTDIKDLVAVDSIENGRRDSLYVTDADRFYSEYGKYFDCGVYNNLEQGSVDIYGINYYASSVIDTVTAGICSDRPLDYERLLCWLEASEEYNGIYILGI